MSESEPRAESRENKDHRWNLDPICNRQGQVMPAGLIKEFPKERQNMGPSVRHQRAGAGGTSPGQGESRQARPGSQKTWAGNMTEAPE